MQEATYENKLKVLNEVQSRNFIEKYDIPINSYIFVKSKEEAIDAANELGFPIVMKVVSPKIVHKTDYGGVQVNLMTTQSVAQAYDTILKNASEKGVKYEDIEGITIQKMEDGIQEIFVGAKRDPIFGPVIAVGLGGAWVELMRDVSLGICPLEFSDVRNMLESLKGYPLLNGYRGREKCDIEALVEFILRFSEMVMNENNILEVDMNPVIVKKERFGVVAVDARIVLGDS